MTDRKPWIIAAGELLAQCHTGLENPDQLSRMSAECMLAVAQRDVKLSTEQVSHLKRCLALEAV